MGEVGADGLIAGRARDGMAIHASLGGENMRPSDGLGRRRHRRHHELCFLPCLEVALVLRDDAKPHPGMLDAAKFRAFAHVGSRLVGLDP